MEKDCTRNFTTKRLAHIHCHIISLVITKESLKDPCVNSWLFKKSFVLTAGSSKDLL